MQIDELCAGQVYSWDDLGEAFGFAPNYLGSAGGMVSRPELGAVVLITHPDGGRSFDYHDYWDGADLIYTGRGQKGDQKLSGPNKYVAENSHALHLFEATGEPRRLKYLGQPNCTEWWWDDGPDSDGHQRKVLRFRLRFSETAPVSPVYKSVGRAKFFGGGESEAHKRLKEHVAANPGLIGLPVDATADVEHSFKSPDRADIVFSCTDARRVAVEIELEGALNTLVGAWQAVKYRTLLCLEAGVNLGESSIECVLVAKAIPASTRAFCDRYGVKWYEIKAT